MDDRPTRRISDWLPAFAEMAESPGGGEALKVDGKRGRGRPKTGIGPVVGVRFYPDMQAELDAWIALQPDPKPSRPEAIRRLLAPALRGRRAS